jgi:hypothetical protein
LNVRSAAEIDESLHDRVRNSAAADNDKFAGGIRARHKRKADQAEESKEGTAFHDTNAD